MKPIPLRPRLWGPLLALAAAGVALGSPGCTKATGSVSGKVTFQGKAVRSGSVLFVGSDSLPHYGQITDEGKYAVANVPAGPAKITVSSPDPKAAAGRGRDDPGVPQRGEEVRAEVKGWFALPNEYGDPTRSKLSFDVRAGTNSHDLELK